MFTRSMSKQSTMSVEQLIKELPKMVEAVNGFKTDIAEMKTTLNNLCESSKNVCNSTGRIEKDISELDKRLCQMDKVISESDRKYAELSRKFNELNERMISMESHSRRDNLLFTGVPETPRESAADCVKKIRHILENTLQLPNAKTIPIVRCHRLGAPPSTNPRSGAPDRPRTVICKFHWYGDRQAVWNAKKNFKDTSYGVQEDFPKEIQDRRKALLPIMFAARRLNYDSYLVVDKLHIIKEENGRKVHNVYDTKTLDKLPESLDIKNVGTVKKDNMFAFFGSHCPLSNFHPAPFIIEGQKYRHVEEYFFVKKAELAGDDVSRQRILEADTPADCKSIGRSIKVDIKRWNNLEIDIMRRAIAEKFNQNPNLKDYLMSTEEMTLAEASPSDRFWGIGAGLGKVAAGNEQFTGKNKLGELLMELRTQLR